MNADHDDIIQNRATLTPDREPSACEEGCKGRRCDGVLLFAMRDEHHFFSMDLETVLQCIRIAEQEGELPALPSEWWNLVLDRYNVTLMDET
jgi:hypothetical protein